jgi:DNA-binding transcriptional MerR regulator
VKLRIDELAARTGETSRNIRAYQARGLLPAPTIEGRSGYYGQEHVTRLEIIDDLQRRGFSLAAIEQTLQAWSQGGDLSHLIGFGHVLMAPWREEEPEMISADELAARFPEATERPELVDRAIEQQLLTRLEQGGYQVPSPVLLRAGEELVRAGVPLEAVLTMVEAVRSDIADVAQRFVGLVAEHTVLPATEAPDSTQVEQATEKVRRLRPIALEVIRPFLAQELERVTSEALREYGARLGDEDGAA